MARGKAQRPKVGAPGKVSEPGRGDTNLVVSRRLARLENYGYPNEMLT